MEALGIKRVRDIVGEREKVKETLETLLKQREELMKLPEGIRKERLEEVNKMIEQTEINLSAYDELINITRRKAEEIINKIMKFPGLTDLESLTKEFGDVLGRVLFNLLQGLNEKGWNEAGKRMKLLSEIQNFLIDQLIEELKTETETKKDIKEVKIKEKEDKIKYN